MSQKLNFAAAAAEPWNYEPSEELYSHVNGFLTFLTQKLHKVPKTDAEFMENKEIQRKIMQLHTYQRLHNFSANFESESQEPNGFGDNFDQFHAEKNGLANGFDNVQLLSFRGLTVLVPIPEHGEASQNVNMDRDLDFDENASQVTDGEEKIDMESHMHDDALISHCFVLTKCLRNVKLPTEERSVFSAQSAIARIRVISATSYIILSLNYTDGINAEASKVIIKLVRKFPGKSRQALYANSRLRREFLIQKALTTLTETSEQVNDGSLRVSPINKLRSLFETDTHIIAVTNFAGSSDLLDFTNSYNSSSHNETGELYEIARGMIRCVVSLHKCGVAHRDISLENFVLNGSHVEVIDFGHASGVKAKYEGPLGKIKYMAPELWSWNDSRHKGLVYDADISDVWSLGVALFVLLSGRELYNDVREEIEVTITRKVERCIKEPALKDIILRCLTWNCNERESIYEIAKLL